MNAIKANMYLLQQRIEHACQRCGRKAMEVTLVAVTKGVTVESIRVAHDLGVRNFGENRIQEAADKIQQLAGLKPDITWHMIGHLQSNKARQCLRLFDLIHSIDSVKLALLLSQQTARRLPVLLQVNIAEEQSKSGFCLDAALDAYKEISQIPNISIEGLMTIAPLVDDAEKIRPVFRKLHQLHDRLGVKHLSMGMSDDFEIAIEEGATMIRIGRAIFGERRKVCN